MLRLGPKALDEAVNLLVEGSEKLQEVIQTGAYTTHLG